MGGDLGLDMDNVEILEEDCLIDNSRTFPKIVDLENNYYLVRFDDERDYVNMISDGPWTIYESYLTVQLWSCSFSSSESHPSKEIFWVRLSGLPYRYYCKALFRRIASVVRCGVYGHAKENCGTSYMKDEGGKAGNGVQNPNIVVGPSVEELVSVGGSRFATLGSNVDKEDVVEVPRDKGERSTQPRGTKGGVVTVGGGIESNWAKVMENVVGRGKGDHTAVSIVEPGSEVRVQDLKKGNKSCVSHSKTGWEVNKRGVQIRKQQDSRLLFRVAPSKWAQ
ncbi:hypothetical protein V6N11_001393 [Hibiscus sabdariffa]|uniref:DUF4283 domain-containing protein n=1 Tax=Hibiscus sabdariffa TaxID=183260 RepID=A0ABR2RZM9_9ROSI